MNELDHEKLDLVLLARIGARTVRPPSRSDVIKSVYALVDRAIARADWPALVDARIASLRARDLVVPDVLQLTGEGRATVTRELGVDRPVAWSTAKAKLLVARALDLDWADERVRRRMSDPNGVRARLIRRRYALPIDPSPTLRQAVDALVWRHLGVDTDRPLTLSRLRAHVLREVLGTDARLGDEKLAWLAAAQAAGTATTHADKVRVAVVASWLEDTPASATSEADAAVATPAPRDADDLVGFARRVRDAARAVDASGRFGDRKVFISAAWRVLRSQPGSAGIELDAFKRRLIDANRAGLVRLHRADLVGAMDPAEVRASEAAHLNATFHFIECEQEEMR